MREMAPVAETVAVVKVTVGRPKFLAGRPTAMGHLCRPPRLVAAPEAEGPLGRVGRRVRVA